MGSDVILIDGLMWQKNEFEKQMNWYDSMDYAENLRLGGYDDWRLPTIKELEDIVQSCGGINIKLEDSNKLIYKNLENKSYQASYQKKGFYNKFYWSSTKTDNFCDAYIILLSTGIILSTHKNGIDKYYTRCVRIN